MKLNFYFTGAALLLVQAGFIYGQNPLPVSQKQATREWVTLMEDPNANFYDIKQKFEEYWQGKTIRPGKGWKPFKRWENFWESRVFPSGTFPKPSIAYEEFTQYKNLQASLKSMLPDNSNWTALGPSVVPTNGGAGRINCIRFHPTNTNIIFIGAASGGLWKTTDGGSTWSSNTDGLQVLGVTDFLIDPTNTNIMYLATGDGDAGDTYSVGVLKSTDGGATWNATGLSWTVNQGRRISKMIMHPSNSSIILAATSNGVYKTINGGTSWTQELVANIKDIEFKPGDPTVVYAARIAFYKSTDTGDNFSQITSGVPTSNVGRFAIGVTANDATYVYLLASNDTDDGLLGVYRSTDSGNNFSTRATTPNLLGWDYDGSDAGGQGWYDLSIAVNPFNKDDVYVGGVNHWRSTNGGTSWTSISHWYGCCGKPYVHADVHALEFLPGSSTTIFSGNDGGFFKTTNNGTSWSDLSAGLSVTQIYRLGLSATNANLALNGNQDNGTNRVSSGTWTRVIGGDGMECIIDYNNANTMYGELYYGEIRKSTNGGSSFSSTIVYSGGSGVDEDGDWVTPYIMHPTNSSTLLVGKSQVYKTTDGGTNWSQIGTISGGTGNIIALAYAPSDPVNIYAAKRDKLYYSSNSGSTWNDRTSGLPVASASITYIAVDPANTQRVWVTFSGYSSGNKVYYSSNAGTSWSNFSGTLPNIPANTIVYEQGSSDGLYIGMDVGVYYRNSSMGDWQTFMNNLPNVIVNELEIHYGSSKIRAATYGRGLWESPLYSAGTPPVAQFSASKTAVCGGLTINFTDLSTNSPTSWSWTINGGTPSSSTAQNPSGVVFNTPGTYTISLIATNAAGNDTETKTNYITVNNCSTKVRTADCGITLSDLNQAIYCDPVSGATNWEWEWVHAASGFSKTVLRNHSSTNFYPGWVGGIQYGKTYDVRVRAYSGGAWGSFGTVCQITTPVSVPATKVRNADCGITLSDLNQAIYCDAVSGATNYEWEWVNSASGFSKTVLRNHSSTNFYPGWVGGIQYGKTYDVRVRAYSGGAWGSFGTVCQITTPASVPGTKVRTADCGITLSDLNQAIYCDVASGATNYEWEWVNAASGFLKSIQRNHSSTNFYPGWVPGIQYGKTYDVRVRAYSGGAWGSFGTVCQITTPASVPATKVRTADCGITLSSLSQAIFCNPVSVAYNYEWEWVNAASGFSETVLRNHSSNNFYPIWVPGIQYGKTYDVRVRAYSAGAWGSFGTVCQITTPAAKTAGTEDDGEHYGTGNFNNIFSLPEMTTTDNPVISIYPNPSDGKKIFITGFKPGDGIIKIIINDITGKNIFSDDIKSEEVISVKPGRVLSQGIYFISITAGDKTHISKLIIDW